MKFAWKRNNRCICIRQTKWNSNVESNSCQGSTRLLPVPPVSCQRVDSSGVYVKRRPQKSAYIHSTYWNELASDTHLSRILQKQPKLEPFGTSLAYDMVISCLIARAQSSSRATLFFLLQRGLFFCRRSGLLYRIADVSGEDAHSRTCGARAADVLSNA